MDDSGLSNRWLIRLNAFMVCYTKTRNMYGRSLSKCLAFELGCSKSHATYTLKILAKWGLVEKVAWGRYIPTPKANEIYGIN